jgi:hypothetical protein
VVNFKGMISCVVGNDIYYEEKLAQDIEYCLEICSTRPTKNSLQDENWHGM